MKTDSPNTMLSKTDLPNHGLSNNDFPSSIDFDFLEAFFLAYRDFIGDADKILEEMDFGRAHHRVLFFVNKNHGLTVAELLEILGITKQSLSRVLRQLLHSEHITQKTGRDDRRQRMLYPTLKGRELILQLSTPQFRRINTALQNSDISDANAVLNFLTNMTNASQKG